jgi:hypothetical protein
MKKSELKEIIKAEFLAEAKDSKKGNEDEQKRMEGAIRDNRDHIKKLKADIEADEKKLAKLKKDYKKDVVKEEMRGEDKDLEEMRGGSTYEEDDIQAEADEVDVEDDVDVDVDVEDDIDIDDVSDKSEIEVDSELSGESSDVSAILGLLTKAQEKAGDMGDEKLLDQIGNTITYYTRAHVVAEMEDGDDDPSEEKEGARRGKRSLKQTPEMKEELNEEFARFQKLAGLIK